MGCDSLCIKDMAGMISPKRAYDIIKGCKDAGIKIPIDLHSHYTSGMTGMAYMRAIEAGVDIVDTAMSPISGGTAQPATESIVAALKGTEWDTGYDLVELVEIRRYFVKIWDKYRHLHRFNALKVDPSVTVHQIPGGMLSNLIFQLEQQGAGDKYLEVLEETARVREELGYPPLVTPTSQVVGVQAVMNVLHGRYKAIPKETKDYCKGFYGTPPAPIKEEIMEIVLGKDWQDQTITCRPADLLEPMWKKRRDELEEINPDLIKKEEDIMTYALYPEVGLKFLKGKTKAEFKSKDLPLPITHKASKNLIKSIFLEVSEEVIDNIGKPVKIERMAPRRLTVRVDGKEFDVIVGPKGQEIREEELKVEPVQQVSSKIETSSQGKKIESPMTGTIMKIFVKEGQKLNKGDTVITLEAMKMENPVICPSGGIVERIMVSEGQEVDRGAPLMIIGG